MAAPYWTSTSYALLPILSGTLVASDAVNATRAWMKHRPVMSDRTASTARKTTRGESVMQFVVLVRDHSQCCVLGLFLLFVDKIETECVSTKP